MTRLNCSSVHNLSQKLQVLQKHAERLRVQGVETPGIVVVGMQSSGKSSLLENITGISFPRAENTCTRVPCVVSLVGDSVHEGEDYALVGQEAELVDKPEFRIKIADVGAEIQRLQENMGETIADRPIIIRVMTKGGPTLSLTDLPGVTHVDEAKEEEENKGESAIYKLTKGMCETYMRREANVVLIVTPAADDLGNNPLFNIAKEVDPEGLRTLGVLTKCDHIVDQNKVIHSVRGEGPVRLKLGFIPVRNRTPAEIEECVTSEELERRERDLFTCHPIWQSLKDGEWGSSLLLERIINIQSERVNDGIPKLFRLVKDQLKGCENELAQYPPEMSEGRLNALFYQLIDSIPRDLKNLLEKAQQEEELQLPRRMKAEIMAMIQSWAEYRNEYWYTEEMQAFLKNKLRAEDGITLDVFINPIIFGNVVQDTFRETLVESADELVDTFTEMIQNVFLQAVKKHTKPYPNLERQMLIVGNTLLDDLSKAAKQRTEDLIDADLSHIHSMNDADYDELLKRVNNSADENDTWLAGIPSYFLQKFRSMTKQKKINAMHLQVLLERYSGMLLDRMAEVIGKVVRWSTIVKFIDRFSAVAVDRMCENVQSLLQEAPDTIRMRDTLKTRAATFREALKDLSFD